MAVRPLGIFLAVVILIAAGIGATYIARSRLRLARLDDAERFAATYSALSFARERLGAYPDSLAAAHDSIYAAHGADSAWVSAYAASLSEDIHYSTRIWDRVVAKLDSLRGPGGADSLVVGEEEY